MKAPAGSIRLRVRPFISARDFHATHHENEAFRFAPEERHHTHCWRLYEGVPGIVVKGSGHYTHEPHWYRGFLYAEERARGLDDLEDLAAPGVFHFDPVAGQSTELAFAPGSRASSLPP